MKVGAPHASKTHNHIANCLECAAKAEQRALNAGNESARSDYELTLAEKLAPGPERDALLKKAQRADTATQIEKWLSSPGLEPPQGS